MEGPLLHFLLIGQKTWSPLADLVCDWPIKKKLL